MWGYKRFNWINGSGLKANWFIVFALVLISSSSCKNEKNPPDILSSEEMVKVLSELYLTEEKIKNLSVSQDSAAMVYDYLNSKVFEKLGTSDSTFRRSMSYYMDRPEEIEKIYAALIDSLNLKEQRLSIPATK
jgi:hypothetical protein